jgi:ribosomal protein L31E
VATEQHPERDPIAEEAERVLSENPGLRVRLEEYARKRRAGETVDVVEHDEVRRRLKALGVVLDED